MYSACGRSITINITMKKELLTFISMIKNKGIAISALMILIYKYTSIAESPFAELVYAVILITASITTAPVVRLLVFPESAHMAERGEVAELLGHADITPALIHYWLTTVISYTITLVCISSLL